jgi:WD repeat-containing protein 61
MPFRTVAFSPCGKHIISGSQMGKINFFNTETGQREQQLDTRGKYTLSIAYVSCD